MGFAVDLGSISSTTESITYVLGVVRDPAIQYTNDLLHTVELSAYYWSQFTNVHDVVRSFFSCQTSFSLLNLLAKIEDVINHFDDALAAAITLDNKILSDGRQITQQYAEILALATRQAIGALEYTIDKTSSGHFSTSDVKAFMKDMGSVGSGG